MQQDFSSLNVGDLVFVVKYAERVLSTVSAATKTQIEVDGLRYNREDGSQRGSKQSYYAQHLEVATPETLAKHQKFQDRRNAAKRLDKFANIRNFESVQRLTDAQLAALNSFLDTLEV